MPSGPPQPRSVLICTLNLFLIVKCFGAVCLQTNAFFTMIPFILSIQSVHKKTNAKRIPTFNFFMKCPKYIHPIEVYYWKYIVLYQSIKFT